MNKDTGVTEMVGEQYNIGKHGGIMLDLIIITRVCFAICIMGEEKVCVVAIISTTVVAALIKKNGEQHIVVSVDKVMLLSYSAATMPKHTPPSAANVACGIRRSSKLHKAKSKWITIKLTVALRGLLSILYRHRRLIATTIKLFLTYY